MVISLVLALLIAIFTCIFALQNSTPVVITILKWKFTNSLALVLLSTFALGAVAGILGMLPTFLRKHFQLSAHKKQLKRHQEEESEQETEEFS